MVSVKSLRNEIWSLDDHLSEIRACKMHNFEIAFSNFDASFNLTDL